MRTVLFPGKVPIFDKTEELALCVPLRPNFPAVDTVIAKLDGGDVVLIPLRITIARDHSASDEKFFSNCTKWATQFDELTVS